MRGTLTTGPSTENSSRQTTIIRRRWAHYVVLVVVALLMFGLTYAAKVTPAAGADSPDIARSASHQRAGTGT
ncbi:hypothetical protein ABN028_27140 [Actinopolymorpha sp. B17G11]|uniref:hypothetical protein n=1 Tax=unclassified Actinopolymorpha TaxID=2627063 RepID=UPI0032D8E9B0